MKLHFMNQGLILVDNSNQNSDTKHYLLSVFDNAELQLNFNGVSRALPQEKLGQKSS